MDFLLTNIRSDVDAESRNGVLAGIFKQLGHQKVIVLHPYRKLFHIWEGREGGGGDKGLA